MRILVLYGSPHADGHTARLLRAFLTPFEGETVDLVDAYAEQIGPCTACGLCKREEACSNPDFDRIDALIRQADLLVVATPVYNLTFPAPLKAIMDRTQRYFEARFSLGKKPPIEKPKRAALLAACGSDDGAEIIERQLKMIFSVMNTRLVHQVVWSRTDRATEREAAEAAERAEGAAEAAERAEGAALAIKREMCYDKT